MQLLVGTYSSPLGGMGGQGEGIYGVSFDANTGAFEAPKLLVRCVNPSAMVLSPDGQILYATREVFTKDAPALLSFRIGENDTLTEVSHLDIKGELPCHLAFDPLHDRLASAQYWTGNIAITSPVGDELQMPTYLTHTGSGPNTDRQEGPHAHFVTFTDKGEVLHAVDFGIDKIISYRLNNDNIVVDKAIVSMPAGSGPRHMVISEDELNAWVICELDETLVMLKREGLDWSIDHVQSVSDLPAARDGSCAAIRLSPDNRHVYISDRRQSSIIGFALDGTKFGEFACGGKTPREFIITADGLWVIVANQDSNTITSLKRNTKTAELTPSGFDCAIGSPAALLEL